MYKRVYKRGGEIEMLSKLYPSFYKGGNFCDCSFSFPAHTSPRKKWVYNKKEEFIPWETIPLLLLVQIASVPDTPHPSSASISIIINLKKH